MKKLLIIFGLMAVVGCSAFKPKKTDFYKNGRLLKSYVGRGVFDANELLGTYKIWAMSGWRYYEYSCDGCEIKETIIEGAK